LADAGSSVFERLRAALDGAGITFTHTRHRAVYTSAEAAEVRGVPLHSGAKALIVKVGESLVLSVMPADLSLDSVSLRKHLRARRSRFATQDEVFELTGLKPGSIPPFGSLFALRTYCDPRLGDNERINFNAGSHTDSFQMAYADYVRFEKPEMVRLAKASGD